MSADATLVPDSTSDATQLAIVSRRGTAKDDTRARLDEDARELGMAIEYQLPQGTLVRVDPDRHQALRERGYWVSVLLEPNILRIGSYTIDVAADRVFPDVPDFLRVPEDQRGAWHEHLLQLVAAPTATWIGEIALLGVQVIRPVSSYGLHVDGAPATVAQLPETLRYVTWAGPFEPAYKVHGKLLEKQGAQRLNISVFPLDQLEAVKQALPRLRATIVRETLPPADYEREPATLIVNLKNITPRILATLARMPGVRWLEPAPTEPVPAGERHTQVIAGIATGAPQYQNWLQAHGYCGKDVVISICDGGVDANRLNNISGHPDLRGRQKAFLDYYGNQNATDWRGHGTLVASIAVGNAATGEVEAEPAAGYLFGQGVAPGAGFISQTLPNNLDWPPDIFKLASEAVTHGAHVMNLSWNEGLELDSGYVTSSRLLDMGVRNPTGVRDDPRALTIVAAAGNVGPTESTIMPPMEAKNPIVVGATESVFGDDGYTEALYASSSRGPALDGRLLPTVVAPGVNVSGAKSASAIVGSLSPSGRYTSNCGTSFAAPMVAGGCALLIEWWREHHHGQDPSPAMLKALLINGADDIRLGGVGETGSKRRIPNVHQGWGRMNLNSILQARPEFPKASRGPRIYLDQEVAFTPASEHFVLCVEPHVKSRPLRVTLVWTDAPAEIGRNPALMNDLDLAVTDLATDKTYKGNHFLNGYSVSRADRDFDRRNNVECVYLASPSGPYEVRVIPFQLRGNAQPPFTGPYWQDFALVIDNAEEVDC